MKIKNHKVRLITEEFIYLEDAGYGLTITNDAEDIIWRLSRAVNGLQGRRVFYKDSFSDIDELVVEDDQFSHFEKGDERIIKQIQQMLKRK